MSEEKPQMSVNEAVGVLWDRAERWAELTHGDGCEACADLADQDDCPELAELYAADGIVRAVYGLPEADTSAPPAQPDPTGEWPAGRDPRVDAEGRRVVRLDELTPEQQRLVLALIAAGRASDP
jgi:hypothetical protein